jgi:hypothetical protein
MKIPDILDIIDVVLNTLPFNPCTLLATKVHVLASKNTHEELNT